MRARKHYQDLLPRPSTGPPTRDATKTHGKALKTQTNSHRCCSPDPNAVRHQECGEKTKKNSSTHQSRMNRINASPFDPVSATATIGCKRKIIDRKTAWLKITQTNKDRTPDLRIEKSASAVSSDFPSLKTDRPHLCVDASQLL